MSARASLKAAPWVLACSLLLNVVFVSCSADAITSPLPQDPTTTAQLTAIMQRLDSIEARTERIDENTREGVDQIIAALSDPSGEFFDALSIGLNASLEVCANLEAGLGVGVEYGPAAEGKVLGRIGPNVLEALAMAGAEVKAEGELKGSGSIDGSISIALCGAADAGLEGSIDITALRDQIRSAVASLGMDGTRLQTFTNRVSTPVGTDYSTAVANIRAALPTANVPRDAFDAPADFLSNSPTIMRFATDNRCDAGVFAGHAALSDIQSRLCGLTMPSAETYLGIINGLDGLPTQVSSLGSGLSSVCNSVLSMVPRGSFSIARRTIRIPPETILFWEPTTYTTFPGYSVNLFSGIPLPTCG